MNRRSIGTAAVLALLGAVIGCGRAEPDRPDQAGPDQSTSINAAVENPADVGGNTSRTGPSGPRSGAADSRITALNGDGGAVDRLVLNTLDDLQNFWGDEFSSVYSGSFRPVSKFISWDAKAPQAKSPTFCGAGTFRVVNAAYCELDDSIGWDRGVLLPELMRKLGPMSVVMVIAHEYGHAIQSRSGAGASNVPVFVKEQQADCLAGVFLRHIAEGDAPHFTLNTTDGLGQVLGAAVAVRDRDPNNPRNEHGSAFERVTAVQMGFTTGTETCRNIDEDEIALRRGTLPVTFLPGEEAGQLPVDIAGLTTLGRALVRVLPTRQPTRFAYAGSTGNCPTVKATEPVSYCPSSRTVAVDVAGLAALSAPVPGAEGRLTAIVSGDYNAFVVFVSRYTLAAQQDLGLSLTGDTAGLRTACLTGAVSSSLSEEGSNPRLSANDLDEAVSAILGDGLAAADVNGGVPPSGFDRLDAFRLGVLEGGQSCLGKFR